MNNLNSGQTALQWLLGLILLTLLTACDGGIFGTGDGSNDADIVGVDASDSGPSNTGDDNDGTENTSMGTEEESEAESPETSTDDIEAPRAAFENLLVGSNTDTPQVTLLNNSSLELNISLSTSSELLFPDNIAPGQTSALTLLPSVETELVLIDSVDATALSVLSPLNLGAFSVTTLIARDQLELSEQTETASVLPPVELVALASNTIAPDNSTATIRLLQVYPLDNNDTAAAMILTPAGSNPGATNVALGTISAASLGQDSTYQTINAGDYQLVDALARFAPVSLSIEAGVVYSLLISGRDSPVITLLEDSL